MKKLLSLLMGVVLIIGTGFVHAEIVPTEPLQEAPLLLSGQDQEPEAQETGGAVEKSWSFVERMNGFMTQLRNKEFWHGLWTNVHNIAEVTATEASEAMQAVRGICNEGLDRFNSWDKRATLHKYVDIVRYNREIIISSLVACYAAVSCYSSYSRRSAEVAPLFVVDRFDYESLEEDCYVGDLPVQAESFVSLIENSGELNGLGVKAEKKLLVTGQSGSGKTALARAIAQKVACPLITIDMHKVREYPVSTMNSYFIGRLQSKIDRVIKSCAQEPVIVLIDNGGYCDPVWWSYIRSLINKENVFVIVTDSEFCGVNSELFDYHEVMQAPSVQEREDLLRYYANNIGINFCVDWYELALRTEGFSPLQLKNLVKKAVVAAVQDGVLSVCLEHFVQAGIYELVDAEIEVETETMVNEQELVHHVVQENTVTQEAPKVESVNESPIGTENQEVGDVQQQQPAQQDIQLESTQQDVQQQELVNGLASSTEHKEVELSSNDEPLQKEVVVEPELVLSVDRVEQVATRSIEVNSNQEVTQKDGGGVQESLNQLDEPFSMIEFASA